MATVAPHERSLDRVSGLLGWCVGGGATGVYLHKKKGTTSAGVRFHYMAVLDVVCTNVTADTPLDTSRTHWRRSSVARHQ